MRYITAFNKTHISLQNAIEGKFVPASEIEFKTKELERLLSERKITLAQYLEMRTKLEATAQQRAGTRARLPAKPIPTGTQPKKMKQSRATYILLVLSLFSFVVGWCTMNSVSVLGHKDFSGGTNVYLYRNSPLGSSIMMAAVIIFSASISYRFTTSIKRGTFIFLEITGLFLLAFGLWIISCGTVNAWVDIPYGAQSYVSIDPTSFLFGLLFTGPGIFAVTYGLVQIRKWFAKSIE